MAQFKDDSVVVTIFIGLCIVIQVADFSTGNSILDIYQNGFSYIFRQTKSECAMHINASHIPATEFFCVIKCHLERVKVSNNLPLSDLNSSAPRCELNLTHGPKDKVLLCFLHTYKN